MGNRGTEVDAGGAIRIDTGGPVVKRLVVLPEEPIKNDEQNPVAVTVTLGLDEKISAGEAPQLAYLLSGQGRAAIAVNATEIPVQSGDVQTWQATFTLPADADVSPGPADRAARHFVGCPGRLHGRQATPSLRSPQ